ncbi:hypothetical protein EMCG_00243 [[Emmonsia] crescens]|uniref:Uncharacterized protein n=1 Tax=[Emmonsia] crescens TaxID=73230 RepID=A0A0G2J9C9_9EURO|nr:hypothetical protein EMCG_00243 [Emmonsia crescens UAMH 3008]
MKELTQNIHFFKEIINKNSDNSDFCLKQLVTAVITQLFFYIIIKRVQYNYIYIREVFIFLHIFDNLLSVMCFICTLSLDIKEINDDSFHLTVIAQILAFILKALVFSSALQE